MIPYFKPSPQIALPAVLYINQPSTQSIPFISIDEAYGSMDWWYALYLSIKTSFFCIWKLMWMSMIMWRNTWLWKLMWMSTFMWQNTWPSIDSQYESRDGLRLPWNSPFKRELYFKSGCGYKNLHTTCRQLLNITMHRYYWISDTN